mmetsp:Transcript_27229/g.49822  ORF Transcript_27229/g.49822 Transcript_27229/m.49822 type:complete len:398 (-) Transcript_27229:650-1843(-)
MRQQIGSDQFTNHRRYTARMLVILTQILARRLHVYDQRNVVPNALPVVVVQRHIEVPCYTIQMDRRVGGSANGRVDNDCVFKGFARHDIGRAQVFPDHIHHTATGFIGHLPAFTIWCWDRRSPRHLHAQRLGKRVHRGRCTHRVAIAHRGGGGGNKFHKPIVVNLARGQHFTGLPDDGAGPCTLALEPAVQHGADRQGDGGDVNRCSRHQQGRGGFVTADVQYDAVQRIAKKGLHQRQIGKVAVQHCCGPFAGFLNGVHGHLDTGAARRDDTVAHPFGQFQVVSVARAEVTACLRDPDDRLARLQLGPGKAVVQVAFKIERRHFGVVGVHEPFARAQVFYSNFAGHWPDQPPSMIWGCPVVKPLSSLARYTTRAAISSADATRPMGWRATNCFNASS